MQDAAGSHISLLQNAMGRFDSTRQIAAARFDSLLHNEAERFDSLMHHAAGSQTSIVKTPRVWNQIWKKVRVWIRVQGGYFWWKKRRWKMSRYCPFKWASCCKLLQPYCIWRNFFFSGSRRCEYIKDKLILNPCPYPSPSPRPCPCSVNSQGEENGHGHRAWTRT